MATKKNADAAKDAAPVAEATTAEAAKGDIVKMKEFMALVNSGLDGKNKVKREAIDAVLGAVAQMISKGDSFQLPTLGRGRVIKVADGMATLKLRLGGAEKPAGKDKKEPLADSPE